MDDALDNPADAQSHPRVAVILLNWNAWTDTIECLESLLRSDYPAFQIVVCDNASTDGSVDQLQAWARGEDVWPGPAREDMASFSTPRQAKPVSLAVVDAGETVTAQSQAAAVVVLRTGGNFGFAGGNNAGLRWALSDPSFKYFWVLNNDTVQKTDAMGQLVARMEEGPKAGICGSTMLYYERPEVIQALNGSRFEKWNAISYPIEVGSRLRDVTIDRTHVERQTDMISGACMFMSRTFLDEVGLMDERYFLYYEEIDWATRSRGRFDHLYAPDAIVYHKSGSTIGTGSVETRRGALSDFYLTQSKLRFTWKHFPGWFPVVYASSAGIVARRMARRQWRHASSVVMAMLGKKWYRQKPY